MPKEKDFVCSSDIIKVDDSLGLVMGYAIICKDKGKDYFDLQGDHIPEETMLKAAVDFMCSERVLGDMHERDAQGNVVKEGGSVVFAWPMTSDIAKAFGFDVQKTGLMIAVKPQTKEMLAKFKSGEYTGFSIGGKWNQREKVAD